MNGNLIVNDRPLLIIPTLAKMIGLNESIILQQFHYWLMRSTKVYNDKKWVYFTYDQLEAQFPFLSKSTIRRTISKLENCGYISSDNFNKMKMDHTKWYTINYESVYELTGGVISRGISEHPPIEKVSSESNNDIQLNVPNSTDDVLKMDSPPVQYEQTECSTWTNDVSKVNRAIPESTSEITTENTLETSSSKNAEVEIEAVFKFFIQNGFGKIGNYYTKIIKTWCANMSCELVIEAMKVALENGSTRWNYVETVLKDWSNKGYQTMSEIHEARLTYKRQKQQQSNKKPIRKEMIPDWLKNDTQPNKPKPIFEMDFEEKKRLFEERLRA